MAVTTLENTLIIHATAAPLFFAGVSLVYFRKFNYTLPIQTAMIFITFVLGIDFFVVAILINHSFEMFTSALSSQYAAATTEAQRSIIEAAGQAMLSVGKSHTPGTFLGFFLVEEAGVMMAFVMLHSKIFSKVSAYAGMLGLGMLLIFEFSASFIAGLDAVALTLAMLGGLLSMAWYILIARRLFQLG